MSDELVTIFQGNRQELEKVVIDYKRLVFAYFFGTWCGPCKILGASVPEIAKEFPNVKFMKLDVDQNAELAGDLNVKSLPNILFLKEKDGKMAILEEIVTKDVDVLKGLIKKYE